MVLYSVKQLLQEAESRALPLWQLILDASAEESGISPEQSWDMMSQRLQAMRLADSSYDPAQRSKSGLSGGDGERPLHLRGCYRRSPLRRPAHGGMQRLYAPHRGRAHGGGLRGDARGAAALRGKIRSEG